MWHLLVFFLQKNGCRSYLSPLCRSGRKEGNYPTLLRIQGNYLFTSKESGKSTAMFVSVHTILLFSAHFLESHFVQYSSIWGILMLFWAEILRSTVIERQAAWVMRSPSRSTRRRGRRKKKTLVLKERSEACTPRRWLIGGYQSTILTRIVWWNLY